MASFHGVPTETVAMADVAIVLLAGSAMAKLSRRLHQPPVVAEIAIGIMLGPSLLGLLPGDLPDLVFPPGARPMLSAIAQVGLLLFMFLVGWELDLGRLNGRRRSVLPIAGFGMAVPLVLGAALAVPLFDTHAGEHVTAHAFALYVGTAFAITAFPVLARIVRDTNLSSTMVGTTAIACAAVADVAAWCLLVVVLVVVDDGGAGHFASVLGLTVLFGLAMAFVVRPVLRRLLRPEARRGQGSTLVVLVAAGILLSSYVTSWIGIHAIFGAFAFGLAIPHDADLHEHIAVPLEKMAALLLPVFFVVTGLSVDLTALGVPGALTLAAIVVVAVVGKFCGASLPARLSGTTWREAGAIGVLMNARGLTEIVVLQVGRDRHIIDAELFTMMVVMALVTTAAAGPLLRLLGMLPSPTPGARSSPVRVAADIAAPRG